MSVRRTALGKSLDMAALAAKNEKTRAVGNMRVNARGDTIDGQGRIIESVNSKVAKQYEKTVGNKSALPVNKKPAAPKKQEPKIDEDLQKLEEEFNDDDAIEMEKEKAKGKK